ncbi:MAG: hypothetical protein AAB425_08700, partial [Bdellovibrionota bacterium]
VRQALRRAEPELKQYADRGQDEVRRQWQFDRPENFTARNQQMAFRYYHLANRADHLYEQLRRRIASLEIEYDIRTYDEQMQQLKKLHDKYRLIQGVTGGVLALSAVTGVGLAAAYPEEYARLKEKVAVPLRNISAKIEAMRNPAAINPPGQ